MMSALDALGPRPVVHRRRTRDEDEPRTLSVRVRVNATELKQLRFRAMQGNVTVSKLLVSSALTDRGGVQSVKSDEQYRVLTSLDRKLSGVANNLNQLTRAVNSGATVPVAQLAATLAATNQLISRIDELVEAVER